MTTTTALDERARLRAEQERARAARAQHGASARELKDELKRLPRERRDALRRQARTGEDAGVEKFDRREAELTAELRRESAAASSASEAGRAAGVELKRLHFDRFGEFAAAAEELTQAAAARLAALRVEYVAAHDAIEEARAEWSLLVFDHNTVLNERSDPAARAAGWVRQRQLSPPPANPLAPPLAALDGAAIRPAEVEPLPSGAGEPSRVP